MMGVGLNRAALLTGEAHHIPRPDGDLDCGVSLALFLVSQTPQNTSGIDVRSPRVTLCISLPQRSPVRQVTPRSVVFPIFFKVSKSMRIDAIFDAFFAE